MSWEEMSNNQYKCPCGSGTYTVKSFMDDWNRYDDHWQMDCPKCKEAYQLYTYDYQDSGMTEGANIWVLKTSYNEINNLGKKLQKLKEETINFARKHYMNQWLSYFDDAKTKKEIWRRLTNNSAYPSLATFYSRTKGEEMSSYLSMQFCLDKLPFIINKLGIRDNCIEKNIKAIKAIEDGLKELHKNIIRSGRR